MAVKHPNRNHHGGKESQRLDHLQRADPFLYRTLSPTVPGKRAGPNHFGLRPSRGVSRRTCCKQEGKRTVGAAGPTLSRQEARKQRPGMAELSQKPLPLSTRPEAKAFTLVSAPSYRS
jgi:hypothetical protein